MLVVSDSYWAIIHRHLTSHWLIFANIIFSPLLFISSVLSISVDNDCSCSSGPEGKQRCKIGQLIFHLQVKVAWNSFPRLYRIYIKKKPKKATFPLRSQRKFTRVHKIKVWSNGSFKATTIDVSIHEEIPLHSFLDRSRNTKPISSHLDRTSFFNKGFILQRTISLYFERIKNEFLTSRAEKESQLCLQHNKPTSVVYVLFVLFVEVLGRFLRLHRRHCLKIANSVSPLG